MDLDEKSVSEVIDLYCFYVSWMKKAFSHNFKQIPLTSKNDKYNESYNTLATASDDIISIKTERYD